MFRKGIGFLMWIGILGLAPSAGAAVHLTNHSLSVNVSKVALGDILHDVSQDGRLNVIVFEEAAVQDIQISQTFQNLSLEAGLDRLLRGLNYAFVRDTVTGRIKTLFVLSQRETVSSSPSHFDTILPRQEASDRASDRPKDLSGVLLLEEKIPEPVPPHELPEFEDFFKSLDAASDPPVLP